MRLFLFLFLYYFVFFFLLSTCLAGLSFFFFLPLTHWQSDFWLSMGNLTLLFRCMHEKILCHKQQGAGLGGVLVLTTLQSFNLGTSYANASKLPALWTFSSNWLYIQLVSKFGRCYWKALAWDLVKKRLSILKLKLLHLICVYIKGNNNS